MLGNQFNNRWKRRVGDFAVAVVLLIALWVSYGCGSEEPEPPGRQFEPAVPTASATPRATPVSVADEEPTGDVESRRTGVSYEGAEDAFRERNYGEATDLFLIYAAENPNNIWGHYMLGLSAWKAGAFPQAETSFERALEIDSLHVKSLVNSSRVLLDTGRPRDALDRIRRVIEINAQSVDGYRLLGRAHADLGNTDQAIEAYVRAITLDPKDAWAMNNLGLIFIRQERFDEALRPLARAVQIRDDVPVFFNNLGIALERTGHGQSSTDAYQRAVELDPAYEKAQHNLARIQNQGGGAETVTADLSVLADEFRRQVAMWQTPVEVSNETTDVDSLPSPTQ